jgi:hypothetical protein
MENYINDEIMHQSNQHQSLQIGQSTKIIGHDIHFMIKILDMEVLCETIGRTPVKIMIHTIIIYGDEAEIAH